MLVCGEECVRGEDGVFVSRSLCLTQWHDPAAGRAHAAEEWNDAEAGFALLQQLSAHAAERKRRSDATFQDLVNNRGFMTIDAQGEDLGKPVCTTCFAADTPQKPLRKCSACSGVRYCSRDCQRTHWPQHREQCRRARGGQA